MKSACHVTISPIRIARIGGFREKGARDVDDGQTLSSSWPGSSRPSTSLDAAKKKDVDGRNKCGHDG
jgi:error-prone DNA polymerase